MNGWIETRSPNAFTDVSTNDVIFRSSGLSSKLVIGNGSHADAALYVEGNHVGINARPRPGISLDVAGSFAAGNPVSRMSFSNALTISSSTSQLRADSKSLALGKVFLGNDCFYTPSLVASEVYKVLAEFPDAHIVRLFPGNSCDVAGVALADFESVTSVRIQGFVLPLVKAEPYFDSVHLTLDSSSLTVGPCALATIDSSYYTNRLGQLVSSEEVDSQMFCSFSSIDPAGFLWIDTVEKFQVSTPLSLSIEGVDELTFFRVSQVSNNKVRLTHGDGFTDVRQAFPSTLERLVGLTSVTVNVKRLVEKNRELLEIPDCAMAFGPTRIVLDWKPGMDRSPHGVAAITHDSHKYDIVSTVPLGANRLAFNLLDRPDHLFTGSGLLSLTSAGVRAVVGDVSYASSFLVLTLDREIADWSNYVSIVCSNATILWVYVKSTQSEVTLTMANPGDSARHSAYKVDDVIFLHAFAPEVKQVLSGPNSLHFRPDVAMANLTCENGLISALEVGTLSNPTEVNIASKKISMVSDEISFGANKVTSCNFSIEKTGVLSAKDLIADSFQEVAFVLPMDADPTREFATYYDGSIGKYVASIELPFDLALEKFAGVAAGYVDGVRYEVSIRGPRVYMYTEVVDAIFDPRVSRSVTFTRDGESKASSFSMTVFSSSFPNDTFEEVVVATLSDVAEGVEKYLVIGPEKSLYFLSGCTNVGQDTWSLTLSLVAGEPFSFSVGVTFEVAFHTSSVPIVANESFRQVSFASGPSTTLTMNAIPITDTLLRPFDKTYVSFFALPSAVVRPVDLKIHPDSSFSAILSDSQAPMTTYVDAMTKICFLGAPAILDSYYESGPDCVVVQVSIPDRRMIDWLKVKTSELFYFEDRPWRLADSKKLDELRFELTLKRLGSPRVSHLQAGSQVYLRPVEPFKSSRRESPSIIFSDGPHTIDAQATYLVLDDSLYLSRELPYAAFSKDVLVQGDLVAQTFSHVSDRAFKESIVERSPAKDLAILRQLNVYDYSFKEEDGSGRAEFGVIADELEALVPEAVSEVTGFVPDVYSQGDYANGVLTIRGPFAEIVRGKTLQLVDERGAKFRVVVTDVYEEEGQTLASLAMSRLENKSYFVHGTHRKYKVANTTHLLMMCLNALKTLA